MNKTTKGALIASLLLLAGVGCVTTTPGETSPNYDDGAVVEDHMDDAMMEKDDAMTDETEAMKEGSMAEENAMLEDHMDDAMMEKDDVMTDETPSGSYEAYASSKLAAANTGNVVLFFHAGWCPTCKALNDSISSQINEIPAGLTILKTDYDTETELKKKYGVTYQHTLVQVDADGKMIKKWSGGNTLESIVSQIQ